MFQSPLSRRKFLVAGTMTAGGLLVLSTNKACASEDGPLIIDCHAHLYSEDEKTYPPKEQPYRPPAGKGTLAHLRREMKAAGVQKAMAVHTFTFYHFDNRYVADACRDNRDILAGVCLMNPDDPESPKRLERYVREYNIRGMRIMPAESGRLDDPGVEACWSAAERLKVPVCILCDRNQRADLEALAGRHPKLPIVIDHCLSLAAGEQHDAVLKDMLELSQFPNLHAKLSYLVTGSAEEYPFRDMHPSCKEIIQAYGPQRCVWGSDFPCELWCPKATYAQHLRVFTHELGLDATAQREILGGTAKRLWFAE